MHIDYDNSLLALISLILKHYTVDNWRQIIVNLRVTP